MNAVSNRLKESRKIQRSDKQAALNTFCLMALFTGTKKYRLSVSVNPTESGTVNPSSGEYEEGESVQITAVPNQHWVFDRWEGDYSGTDSSVNIIMDRDKEISALFVMRAYPLTVEIEGQGTVTEQIFQQKTTDYEAGTLVELTAVADEGWRFSHWEGDVEGNENPVTIEISGEKTVTATWNNGEGFKPIGFLDTRKFTGSYDGGGFQINGLTINLDLTINVTEFAVGLYGFVDHAHIKNLTLEDVSITGAWGVGGLAGNAGAGSLLENVHVISGSIAGTDHVGGLVGYLANSEILMATSQVSVEGNNHVGGLVGFYTGDAVISETYAEGNVSSDNGTYIGGLVGRIGAGKVYKSYALGDVSGSIAIGGLIGRNDPDGVITESYSAGLVSGSLQVGGLIGSNQGVLNKSYWDSEGSGQNSPVWDSYQGVIQAIGLTTSQMTGSNAQANMPDFDWVNTWEISQNYPDFKVFTAGNNIQRLNQYPLNNLNCSSNFEAPISKSRPKNRGFALIRKSAGKLKPDMVRKRVYHSEEIKREGLPSLF